jgi:small subunit ribosomal protein S5
VAVNNDRNSSRENPRENRRSNNNDHRRSNNNDGSRNGPENSFVERLISVNRVAKVLKGGRRFAFSALVCVGDQNGTVGVGSGKAREVAQAITKATANAHKNLFKVPRIGKTIPHPVQARKNAGEILLKPASPGTGVIAGGPARAVLECAGIHDILSKSLGSQNALNIVQATLKALRSLEQIDSVAARRQKPLNEVAPNYLVKQYQADLKKAEPVEVTPAEEESTEKTLDKDTSQEASATVVKQLVEPKSETNVEEPVVVTGAEAARPAKRVSEAKAALKSEAKTDLAKIEPTEVPNSAESTPGKPKPAAKKPVSTDKTKEVE